MSLGNQISYYRKKANITQAQLAEALDVSFQAVSSWERDEYAPDVNRLTTLAKALGTSAGRLVEEFEISDWQLRSRLFDEKHMYTFVKSTAVAKGLEQTCRVLPYAKKCHSGQVRKGSGGEVAYINHPLTMACHALAMGLYDDNVIAALLLHDVVEDCDVTADVLPVNDEVKAAVRLVSFDVAGQPKAKAKKEYYSRIAENPFACLVKCIDRINNLSNMAMGFTHEKMVEYVNETEQYIVPLLRIIKDSAPEWNNAAWLLSYQMYSILETYKRLL